MELFTTDRDRLAFLLETDAALDTEAGRLDMEARPGRGGFRRRRLFRLGGRGLHVQDQGPAGPGQRPASLLSSRGPGDHRK